MIIILLKILTIIILSGAFIISRMLREVKVVIPFDKKENKMPIVKTLDNTKCSLILDGDVDKINFHENSEGYKQISLDLGHRANNWNIFMNEKELEYLLKTLRESKNDNT